MKYSHFRLIVFSFLLLFFNSVNGQTLVNTTGNSIKNNTYHFDYSIGEIAITTLSANGKDITQGLLQPEIKKIVQPCDVFAEKVKFENPTRDFVRFIGSYDWVTDYKVYAADGKLVKAGLFNNNAIDITLLQSGIYFIKLFPGCNGNFKVLKVAKKF